MFLTKMPVRAPLTDQSLEKLTGILPSPLRPLRGKHSLPQSIPDNIVCFCRRSATDLNRPQRGRALHHRFVLIIALQTAVTVCVDDRAIRLHAGEGLLVMPFQFHDYIDPEQEKLLWLFMTFEVANDAELQPLRFRPFALSPAIRQLSADLLRAYLTPGDEDLVVMTFALLLARIRKAEPIRRRHIDPPSAPGLIMQINQIAQRKGETASVKEIARALGISSSHLRSRFKASCGVSLGRHLRRLRLEKACGLLRLSSNRVTEIAELCGFNSIFSFSRAFHMAYGIAPMAYRKGDKPLRPGK